MRLFRKKHDLNLCVGKDLQVYLMLGSEVVEKSVVISPTGKRFEGSRIVKICTEPKENCPCGTYTIEVTVNGKTEKFSHALKGYYLNTIEVIPSWNRYEGISAFYVLSKVKYTIENNGDMPFFFTGKDFRLPTGYVTLPDFFVLPKEVKRITCYVHDCDRVAMVETEDYEEALKDIGRKIEGMGRARFGLATSAL